MKRWILQWVVPIAGYIVTVGMLFGTTLFPKNGFMIFGDDITHQYYFLREFFNHFLRMGIFPWWNPYNFSGQPFIADPMVNIWYPLTWLFVLLPLPVAYAWHMAFHVFWASLGMGIVSSQFTVTSSQNTKRGISLAGWVSGVLFGLSGFFMARTWAGHVDVIAAASWMPWVVWAFYRLLHIDRARFPIRECGIAAVLFAVQLFSGYQTMAFMTAIIIGIIALVYSMFHRSIRPILYAGITGFLGICLAAIQIFPVQEFFRMGIRTYTFPYTWNSYGSWTWASFLQLLNPFVFGNPMTYTGPQPNFIEHSVFVGVAGLTLAIVGIIYTVSRVLFPRSSNKVLSDNNMPVFIIGLVYIVVTLFGLWVSLGPNAPIDLQYILWKIIPMYHYLRIPPRHLILVAFGLSGLAGIGFTTVGILLKKRNSILGIIVGVVIVEMLIFGWHFIGLQKVPSSEFDTNLIALLHHDAQPYRVLQNFGVWLPPRDSLDFASTMKYQIYSVTGYDVSILRPYYEYVANAAGQKGSDAILSYDVQVPYLSPASGDQMDYLNIKYILVPPDYDPFQGVARYKLIREDTVRKYRLYENTTVKERFFLDKPGCGSARVTSYTPNEIRIAANTTCGSNLLSSEVWYPGWEAKVDGKSVRIGKAYSTFRTLFVPSGKHTLVYQYSPKIFVFGGLLSLGTAILLLYLVKRQA